MYYLSRYPRSICVSHCNSLSRSQQRPTGKVVEGDCKVLGNEIGMAGLETEISFGLFSTVGKLVMNNPLQVLS